MYIEFCLFMPGCALWVFDDRLGTGGRVLSVNQSGN